MALTLSSTISFAFRGYVAIGTVTTASVSLPANSLVVVVAGHSGAIDSGGGGYGYAGTPTNTGTALTWTYASGALNNDGTYYDSVSFFWAKNTSAQTVTITSNFTSGADFPVLSVVAGYVFTGHKTTTPVGAVGGGNTGTITTTAAGSYVVSGIVDGSSTTYTSSNMTYQVVSDSNADGFAAYASKPTAGSFTASYASGSFFAPAYEIIEVLAASGTAHTAAASATATATGTAAMSSSRVGAGSGSETATGTAAASNLRVLAGSATATASGTAAMVKTQIIDGSGTGTASGVGNAANTRLLAGSATVTAIGTSDTTVTKEANASATVTATGTSEILKTKNVSASGSATASGTGAIAAVFAIDGTGTVTASGSVDFSVTPVTIMNGNGTVVAEGSTAVAKTMQLAATATATATSSGGMTHTFYVFSPPTREISPVSLDPYFQLVGYLQGRTLVRRSGVWKLVQNKRQEYLDESEYVFLGGCQNRINGTEKAALESAGYTVETRTS
jgi:hypothetical protein